MDSEQPQQPNGIADELAETAAADAVGVLEEDAAEDLAAAPEAADDSGPDEGAWAGMPEQAWADEGRWGDDAEVDVGLPVDAAPRNDPSAEPQSPQGYASTVVEVQELVCTPEGDFWQGVVQQLVDSEAIVALARQLALQSQLMAREGDLWTLRVETNSLNQAGSRERLRAALEAAGHARQLQVEQGAVTDTPARRMAVITQARQRIAEEIVTNHSMVQTLVREHGAKIVPGSIKPVAIRPE